MTFKVRIVGSLIIVIGFFPALGLENGMLYPEFFSLAYLEELENEGECSFRISMTDRISYRVKTRFSIKGFVFHYSNEGGTGESDHLASLEWNSKYLSAGIGKGQPNIAKGVLLGNTMMRMTPNLGGNAGVRSAKIDIKNYNYFNELGYFNFSLGPSAGSAFYYNGVYGALYEYATEKWLGGIASYHDQKILTEAWGNYKNKDITLSLNASLVALKLNHVCADLYYRNKLLALYVSAISLSSDFMSIKCDSKWGSGLKPGSTGIAAGLTTSFPRWKANMIAYRIIRNDYEEQRVMMDLRFRSTRCELNFAYTYKHIQQLDESEMFPFALDWHQEISRVCKLNCKIKVGSNVDLQYQLQGDVVSLRAYAEIIRLTYKNKNDLLRFQLSRSQDVGSKLYYLRPLTPLNYSIRSSLETASCTMDLMYSRDIGIMKLYVLLRTEGMNVGFLIK